MNDAIQAAFAAQLPTALRLRQSTLAERKSKIRQLRDAVLAHQAEIIQAGWDDFRKPATEVELTEILPVVAEANDALRKLKSWMKPVKVWPSRMMLGTVSHVQYQPKGRCLIISPWNYPVNLSFGPLISAISAGNTVIIKPSEMTPHASAIISKIIREVFNASEVTVIEGDASIATALLALPFDHIFFTGSPAIGKVVMAAAARNLTSVTLELGGKSPTIVDASADIELAAKNILWAKFTNNGQTCIAPDYIYVHAQVKQAFIAACQRTLTAVYGAQPQQSECLARVVNQRHTEGLLNDAREEGANIIIGGVVDAKDCFIAPTLIDGVTVDSRIMQEEIFGPLLPIIKYTDLDEIITHINSQPKPLALYVWSKTPAVIHQLMTQTSSGVLIIVSFSFCMETCHLAGLTIQVWGVHTAIMALKHFHMNVQLSKHESC